MRVKFIEILYNFLGFKQQNSNDDQNIKYQNFSEIPIEWPREYGDYFEKSKNDDEENDRPDSGVGESVSFKFT